MAELVAFRLESLAYRISSLSKASYFFKEIKVLKQLIVEEKIFFLTLSYTFNPEMVNGLFKFALFVSSW